MSKKTTRERHTLDSAKADVLKTLHEATALLSALSTSAGYFPNPEEITTEVMKLRRAADQFITRQVIK